MDVNSAPPPPGGCLELLQEEEVFRKWTRQAREGIEGKGRRRGSYRGGTEKTKNHRLYRHLEATLTTVTCLLRLQHKGSAALPSLKRVGLTGQVGGRATGSCGSHASGVREIRCGGHTQRRVRGSGQVGAEMKLKQRMVVLFAVLLLLGLAKIFLLDGGEGSAASRRDLRAFRKMEAGLTLSRGARLTHTLQSPWEIASQWVGPREVYPEETPELAAVLSSLSAARIERADVGYKGTQLKALLVLDGGQKVPYAGYDRHNAEVAAFHLDRILGFRRAPLVVGRYVNVRTEIKPVATDQLLSTFLMQGNNTCFYGKCYYCRESEPACAEGEIMEGSLTLWLPDVWPLQKHRHPWGRTYREGKLARWEYDESYCEAVKKMPPYDAGPRLLDVIDTAIFDYLIGNADRHHYESFQDDGGASMLILLDNAKRVRVSTWNRLNLLRGGALSSAMRQALAFDPIHPVLAEPQLAALDRRLSGIIATVKQCMEAQGPDNALIEDRINLPHP
ncbi:hypothetical protein FQN60_012640 [Etheostoma spectabile]|uniref:FAM20 C-terminal domain-containing protein n=1 Tax=Etheostoma spectabile TaxID=54343 RepID=A0A5J5D9S5_9PERO|nr:hypothetical protein FQN60_012640 [Etheostoma spectabile]